MLIRDAVFATIGPCGSRVHSTAIYAVNRTLVRSMRGVLHVIFGGVYAVGHRRLSRERYWMAAVLADGPGAVLSHRSAAALWGIRDTHRARPEVTANRHCRRAGIDAHRVALPADEITEHRGIPVTTPARTLLDLAEILDFHQLQSAVHETEYRRLTSPLSLDPCSRDTAGAEGPRNSGMS